MSFSPPLLCINGLKPLGLWDILANSTTGFMIMASHRTFSSQNEHMSGKIKFGYIINGNFIELVENNERLDKFWSIS